MIADVTVIIPCYGQSEYLLEAVESCKTQTIQPKEIIAILMDEESYNLRSKLGEATCVAKPRLNVPTARNIGFSLAKTKFVVPLDADDKLPENYVEALLNHSDKADVVYPGSIRFGDSNEVCEPPSTLHRFTIRRARLPTSLLYRKRDWKESGGFNEDFSYGNESEEFNIRLFLMGKIFVPCFEVKQWYRVHGDQTRSKIAVRNREIIQKELDLLYPQTITTLSVPLPKHRPDFTLQYEKDEKD